MRRTGVALLVALGLGAGVDAHAERVLTLRGADRIIDRAFLAELAGDFAGSRDAVRGRLEAATRPEEEPGKARLRRWLVGQQRRKEAFAEYGRTAEGYWQAFRTLRDSGHGRADLLWRHATRDIPNLEREFERIARVDLRFERVVGLDDTAAWARHLSGVVAKHHLAIEGKDDKARYEVRIYLDAKESAELMNRWRVTAEGDYLLRDRHDEGRLVGSFTKRRTVVRLQEDHARRFAVRRVLDDLGRTLVHQIREDVLRDLAAP